MKYLTLSFLFIFFLAGCSLNDLRPKIGDQELIVDENADQNNDFVKDNDKAVEKIIIGLFAEQFDMDSENISLQNIEKEDHYVSGMVIIGEGGPGGAGGFLASDIKGDWEIVWDGNGLIDCAQVDEYDFPEEMLRSCYNADGIIITKSEKLLVDLLRDSFIKEPGFEQYMPDDITIEISDRDDLHAKGTVMFGVGGPGNAGGFLAANTLTGWVLVWHGNGVYVCDDLAEYDFPASMTEGCYNG